jgi:hypothetical protein
VSLTSDQRHLFDEYRPDRFIPSGDQTPEQVRNFSAGGFARVCELELGDAPTVKDVLAEMDRVRNVPRTYRGRGEARDDDEAMERR